MSGATTYFALRDDDTCYFTRPGDLESCYGDIWDVCPVSLSVVPFHACTKSAAVPERYWSGSEIFPLDRNQELVSFLRDGIARGRLHVTLHGYHHRGEPDGYEFVAGKDLAQKVVDGKRYLEELLGQPIRVFVPPHNSLGPEGYRAVVRAGLHISGVQSFRPSLRGWDPRVLALGIRERLWLRRCGYRRPWPVVFPDGHRELAYRSLTPEVSLETVARAFATVRRKGGTFCLATHHWEFDVPGRGQPWTIRQVLRHFWKELLLHPEQIAFLTLSAMCALQRP